MSEKETIQATLRKMEEESRSCLQAIHSGTSEWKDAKKEEFISKWNQVMEKAESYYTSGEAAMKAIDAFFSKAEEHYQ